MKNKSTVEAVTKAVQALGGPAKTAQALEVSITAVMQWCSGKRPVPALRAKAISDLLGGSPSPGEMSARYEAFALMFKEAA